MISPPETRIYIHWDFFKTFPFGKIRIRNFVAYAQRSLHGGKVKLRAYELRAQIHELRVQIHELQVQIYELRVQIHELRVQIHELED